MASTKTENYTQQILDQAKLLKALGHPARVQILKILESSDRYLSIFDLSLQLGLTESTVQQHLTKLKSANLLKIVFVHNKSFYLVNSSSFIYGILENFSVKIFKAVR